LVLTPLGFVIGGIACWFSDGFLSVFGTALEFSALVDFDPEIALEVLPALDLHPIKTTIPITTKTPIFFISLFLTCY
jgi:hypothetical protein